MMRHRQRSFWLGVVGLTVLMELVTAAMRLTAGQSAAEYIAASQPPWIMQIHHMFWSVPLIVLALVVPKPPVVRWLWMISLALIVSDLCHHFDGFSRNDWHGDGIWESANESFPSFSGLLAQLVASGSDSFVSG